MIATIAAIAGKKTFSNRGDHMETTDDRSDHSISQRSLKSGFHMIATIAERFFQRSQRSYGNQT